MDYMGMQNLLSIDYVIEYMVPAYYHSWADFVKEVEQGPGAMVVKDLARLVKEQKKLRPIEVEDKFVVDGCHRVLASFWCGLKTIEAVETTNWGDPEFFVELNLSEPRAENIVQTLNAFRSFRLGPDVWVECVDFSLDEGLVKTQWSVMGDICIASVQRFVSNNLSRALSCAKA